MLTLREFRKRTDSGLFARRDHVKFAHLENLLRNLEALPANPDPRRRGDEEMTLLLLVIEEGDLYPTRHPQCPHLPVIAALRREAVEHVRARLIASVKSNSRGDGKRGWTRVRAALHPIVRGARADCLILNAQYWGEAVVEEHYPYTGRNGAIDTLEIWKHATSRASYIDWLRDEHIPSLNSHAGLTRAARTLSEHVIYGDDADRARWRVVFRDGLLHDHAGRLFHTGLMVGARHHGWAIFVRTPDGVMYAHEPRVNQFHHSSFNAGGPVRSAGEIAVRHGVVAGVSNKSGHYTPSLTHFLELLRWLQSESVDLTKVAACIEPMVYPRIFHRASDVLAKRGAPLGAPVPEPCVEGAL